MYSNRPHLAKSRAGFALLITIILVSFLVLLLVGLATFTRVETTVATNSQQLAQARQNALVGLNVALGRLQSLAGPDQRVTGTADLVSTTVARDDTKRNWTGVWQGAYTVPATPNQLGWLVSGTQDASGAFQTGSAVVTGTMPSDNTTVTLVGANSTDASLLINKVTVRKEAITSTGVPGLSGSQTTGHFAYWVGDEGVKARLDLSDPYASSSAADIKRYSYINGQRNGIERVDMAADPAATTSPLATAYPVNDPILSKLISRNQLPFINTAASANLTTVAKTRFHDLTTSSLSIPADVARGGLKRDLSAWLNGTPAGAAETDNALIYDPATDGGGTTYGLPKWGIIRDYWNTKADGSSKAAGTQTDANNAVHPVITYLNFGMNVSSSASSPNNPFILHLFPVIVLWNPFNVPITADTYEVAIAMDNINQRIKWTTDATVGSRIVATLNLANASLDAGDSNSNGRYQYWRFRIACPSIPAGASMVFRPGATGSYTPGVSELVHSASQDGFSFTLSNPGATLTDPERAQVVTWDFSAVPGQSINHIALRKASAPFTAPTDFSTALPGALHTLQHLPGQKTIGSNVTTNTANPTASLTTRAYYYHYPRMSSEQPAGRPRWIAQQNFRAPQGVRMTIENTVSNLFGGNLNTGSSNPSFGPAGYASAGYGVVTGTRTDLALAYFLPPNTPLFSLAQLQHASVSLIHANPTYPLGNSMADPLIALDRTRVTYTPPSGSYLDSQIHEFYDLPYVLNRELWDRYYFSTVPQSLSATDLNDSSYTLPNARITFHKDGSSFGLDELSGANAFRRSAAHLFIKGGFNINSTSFQAWRALLAAHRDLVAATAAGITFNHLINRDHNYDSTKPINNLWWGQRILTDAQIDRLAWNIVQEVKNRGPFVSLADFVNRRLINDAGNASAYKGPLQAAIDLCDTETSTGGGPPLAPINTSAMVDDGDAARDFLGDAANYQANSTAASYDLQRSQGGPSAQMPYSSRSAFAPGYFSQADLLSMIGPSLTARSDTFIIRSYGESINPATGTAESSAWCEATVQRMPEYVAPSATQQPWDVPVGENATFGRRFKIVSMRWLSPNDI